MPPRTRATKSTKALKENVGIPSKLKVKAVDKVTKPPRKVLGDKTNSASDDNASIEIPNKPAKTTIPDIKLINLFQNCDIPVKSRRERRVPSRLVDSQISKNKENTPIGSKANNENCVRKPTVPVNKSTIYDTLSATKNDFRSGSPFKTPEKHTEVSLVANRPRRISRLPSKFEDHSVSPSKFIPVQPCHASTPLATKTAKTQDKVKTIEKNDEQRNQSNKNTPTAEKAKLPPGKKTIEVAPDTNNNAKGRLLRSRKAENDNEKEPMRSKISPVKIKNTKKETNSVKKLVSPLKNKTVAKKVVTPIKKVSPLKQKPKKDVSPDKNITSKTKKSPIEWRHPVEHSYLDSVNKSSSFSVEVVKSPVKLYSGVKKPNSRTLRRDLSFKVLEENNKKQNNQDIYEFTFDPSEEPAPQKKKRKAVKRKPAKPKPKAVIFKNNYDQNVNKALAALKNVVTKKAPETKGVVSAQKPNSGEVNKIATPSNEVISNIKVKNTPQVQRNIASKIIIGNTKQTTTNNIRNIPQIQENILLNTNTVHADAPPAVPIPDPNQSIRVEDIAADFDFSPQHDMDYSPVNSPIRPKTPVAQISRISDIHHSNDPLNLRENITFDPNPIASSSMNTSVRHPQPSPWRVEFESLPIRWHVNSYVKPNMTPAVECSFVNFDDKNKKKHVYTNLVPRHDDDLPEIAQKDQPNLIQSSIFSFIKEQIEKSSSKKKRARSVTPVSASLFNDTAGDTATNKDDEKVKKTAKQLFTPKKNNDKAGSDTSNPDSSKDTSNDKENSKNSSKGLKRKNNEEANDATPAKTRRKDKDDKYFGFDDSENLENVSPQKEFGRKKSVRQAHARAVLKEKNAQPAPTRAVIPLAAKTARMVEVERLYDEMKSASDAPALSAKEPTVAGAANVQPMDELDDDTQTSVHLFEDVEDLAHHWKPNRKSYGKAKKVTFMRKDSSDTQDSDPRPTPGCDEEDDLLDLTFDPGLPLLDEEKKKTKKKPSKRQKMTKKEEEEAEAWAAGFNSMCEDVEGFDLVVE